MTKEKLIDEMARAIATSLFGGKQPSPANCIDYRTEAEAAYAVIAPELEKLRAKIEELDEKIEFYLAYGVEARED